MNARFITVVIILMVLVFHLDSCNKSKEMKMENNFLGLAHICIFTDDLEKSAHFYTDKLHFKKVYETLVMQDHGDIKYAVVKLKHCIIELLEPIKSKVPQLGTEGAIAHFAIEVNDLNKVVNELKAKHVEFTSGIITFDNLLNGVQGAFIKGPSGELIELFEYKNEKPSGLQ